MSQAEEDYNTKHGQEGEKERGAEKAAPPRSTIDKPRLIIISALAIVIAVSASLTAKLLVVLIDLVTSISFYGSLSAAHSSPANNSLGIFVLLIPSAGGVIVGLMAFYGSKAIRGHGIPEAMEQILTNQSRIQPLVTILKPLSSAISIGSGGPFGAEGPIIATGGALGSTVGQLLKISHMERKILLAAGAAAGMAAIFGSPIAAVFLAIELLLFEFSPRSIIPVALACLTGAVGHRIMFQPGPIFAMREALSAPSSEAIALCGVIGIIVGFASIAVTRLVYVVEDSFEKIPVHWMWWPAIGGIAVGAIGYYSPETLGVGYENIRNLLSGNLPIQVLLALCFLKFISWAIALGSGTSGGTLAPLMTIGGAAGALIGAAILRFFPTAQISLPLAALVGMVAMFAGASRAVLTSILFALETTGQMNGLLPVLASCTSAYFVSLLFMENTIMTEKIARRGVKAPHSYESDILERMTVRQLISGRPRSRETSEAGAKVKPRSRHHPVTISEDETLRFAVELMAEKRVDLLQVRTKKGVSDKMLTYEDILRVYKDGFEERSRYHQHISLKRSGLKILLRARDFVADIKRKVESI